MKAHALKELGEIQKVLRRIPIIELNTPTVVLVGAPNVGKSTIVRAVSSGTPEVCVFCLCFNVVFACLTQLTVQSAMYCLWCVLLRDGVCFWFTHFCDTHSTSHCICMFFLLQVNDYPFTTRGVTVGHIVDVELNKRYQVMDTPGTVFLPLFFCVVCTSCSSCCSVGVCVLRYKSNRQVLHAVVASLPRSCVILCFSMLL